MPRQQSPSTRSLPAGPSLVQLRKLAKELLKSYRAGDQAAAAEVAQFEKRPDPADFKLADAQRVLARAHGFASWTKLKQHVEGLTIDAFRDAVESGDLDRVRDLAEQRPDFVGIECGGIWGERIALHFAVLNRDRKMTALLMQLGSDARKGFWPYRDATSATTIAAERGYDDIVEIIERAEQRRLLAANPPQATVDSRTDQILTAILEDRGSEAISLLEGDLALAGACNSYGVTPLHMAAWKHDPETAAWLLDHGTPVDPRSPYYVPTRPSRAGRGGGTTPLDYAAIVAGWSVGGRVLPFLENANLGRDRFEQTMTLLLDRGAEWTPRAAVAFGPVELVSRMHREGRLINQIHFRRGGLLSIAVRVNRRQIVELLLDWGFDPDEPASPTENGEESWGMPLWFAALCGRHDLANLLLDRGADVNAVVHACGDALSITDLTNDERMRQLLLQRGAQVAVEHIGGRGDRRAAADVLDGKMPARSLDIDDPSREKLAEQMLTAAAGTDAEIVRLCLAHACRVLDDAWWHYALMRATLPASFKLILDHGVDPNVCSEAGQTPLHHLATEERDLSFAQMLLDAGAKLDRRDELLRSTPLGWACRWGRRQLVQFYLEQGADAVESDADAWATPIAWARKGGHNEIAELLKMHGAV